MSAQTKKGPKVKEYLDDPECKYVVIQGPWPGNKQGRDRDKIFYNLLGAWVRYMLGKRTFVEAIYSMNKVWYIIYLHPFTTSLKGPSIAR